MTLVSKTTDANVCYTFELPSDLTGTVYIRVLDTDQTIGNRSLNTIYIDYMYIESECW